MRNGNVMEYTRSNPEANRLQLVSPLVVASQVQALNDVQLSEVTSGAAYLHDLGVVHGDLKGVWLNISQPFFSSR